MPAGAHSVKKPSQHSLIIITTFAYIFSVSGGSAAALKTINNMTIRIPDGNAFRIRLTARNLISGEYTEAADLSNIDNLVINYVRRGIRFPHAYTIDEEGRATVADAGTLDCGFYGIELTGYYGGEKFRFYGKDLFEITTDTTDVIAPSNLIDIEITVKLNASGVSKDYVDHAINGMETSMETMQADLRDEIAEAGKVDDVKVNGVSVVFGKKANITVPTKVSDLNNDSEYQNEQQVQQKVDAAKITSADISVDGGTGTPSGSAGVSGNKLVIALHNIKGEKGDPGESIVGPQGPQGATSVYDQNTQDFLTTLETTTGQSQTKTMTQKAITDELFKLGEKLGEFEYLGDLPKINCCLTDNNWGWKETSPNYHTQRHSIVEVQAGDILLLKSSSSDGLTSAKYAWLDSTYINPPTGGTPIPFVNGTSSLVEPIGTEFYAVAPEGAAYLCLDRTSGTGKKTEWQVLKRNPLANSIDDVKSDINEIKGIDDELAESIVEQTFHFGMKLGEFGEEVADLPWVNCCLDANTTYWRWRTNGTSAQNERQKHSVVSVQPGDIILLNSSGTAENATYAWLTDEYTGEYTEGDPVPFVDGTAVLYKPIGQEFPVIAPEGAAYLCLSRVSWTAKTMNWKVCKRNPSANAIEDIKDDVRSMVANAKFVHRATESHTQSLGLLHFTDIHGDSAAAEQVKKWIYKYRTYIDDVLNTGDMVKSNTKENPSQAWWQASGLAEISLSMIGNHDGAYKNGTSEYDEKCGDTSWYWNGEGKAWDFGTYIEPYHEGWGVTMPDGYDDPTSPNYKACYYHKDYAEQKVRLICLDCMHRFDGIVDPETGQPVEGSTGIKTENLTTEQEEWLVEKLNETLDNSDNAYGYSVVVACHFPLDDYTTFNVKPWAERVHDYTDFNRNDDGGVVMDYKTGESTNWQYMQQFPPFIMEGYFCLRNHTGFNANGFPVKGNVNNFGNIIDAFINRGGKFVVWLSGHVHCDMLYYPDNYPNILVCANTMAGQGNGTDREDRAIKGVAANFVAIDTANGLFKIVRLGLNTNKYLTPINYLCYDYINKKIISEG